MVGTDHPRLVNNHSKNVFSAKEIKPNLERENKSNYEISANGNSTLNNRPVKSSAILMKDEMNISENRKGKIVIGGVSPPRLVLRNNLFSKNRDLYQGVGKQIAQNNKIMANNLISESALTSPTDKDISQNTKIFTNKRRINKNSSNSNIIGDTKDAHFYQKFVNFQSTAQEELKKAAVELNAEIRSNQTLSRLEHDSADITRNKRELYKNDFKSSKNIDILPNAIKSFDHEVKLDSKSKPNPQNKRKLAVQPYQELRSALYKKKTKASLVTTKLCRIEKRE